MSRHDGLGHELLIVFIRTVILYVLAWLVLRLAGKRTLGKMDTFDFVVTISVGSAVAIGMEADNKFLPSVLPIIMLGGLQWMIAKVDMASPGIEKVTRGRSVAVVQDGKVVKKSLESERITKRDLMMELRQKGFERVEDVKEAMLEPTGKMSVLPTNQARPLTMADLTTIAQAVAKELAKGGGQGGGGKGEKQGG